MSIAVTNQGAYNAGVKDSTYDTRASTDSSGFELTATFTHLRYEDRGLIGAGGMGEVRRIYDRRLGATLAMKLLSPRLVQDSGARQRFANEAQLTAHLSHPGIVAAQDLGELEDGRLWFTMAEVRGQTLDRAWEGQTLRQRMEHLVQVSRAVAYAHAQGVVHRDLKPRNIMVGAFGEVRVMDWGIAQWSQADPEIEGQRIGTPAWMSPEQAAGDRATVGPATDVYALGGLLEWGLTSQLPGRGTPPPGTPAELVALAHVARSAEPHARPTAERFVGTLLAWLEGSRRREEALRLVAEADARAPAIRAAQARAEALTSRAAAWLGDVLDHEPVSRKAPGWALEDEAAEAEVQAATQRAEWLATLQAALVQVPDLPEAHDRLATYHRAQVVAAERVHDRQAATLHLTQLRQHAHHDHAAFIEGSGTITLVTDPPGATVQVCRYAEQQRQLVPVSEGVLGTTPLHDVPLSQGSYLLVLEVPGRPAVRYPVRVERGTAWCSVAPGETAPFAIPLPHQTPPGTEYIAPGWFEPGGDPHAIDPARIGPVWVDGFYLMRHPVTLREYLAFLDEADDPESLLPTYAPRGTNSPRPLVELRQGHWQPITDKPLDIPVTQISPLNAIAFAAWRSARDGVAWRLPHGIEWEKACRGADQRPFATGAHLEPTRTMIASSRAQSPTLVPVQDLQEDLSPYGIYGMTGNAQDICANAWTTDGGTHHNHRLVAAAAFVQGDLPEVRGGSYAHAANHARAASRLVTGLHHPSNGVGFRLCISLR